MRTTLTLDDDLAGLLKRRARELGRSRFAGTRIGVDFVLELLASGWSSQRIVDEYPQVKAEDLQAVFAFLRDGLGDEDLAWQRLHVLQAGAQRRPDQ